MPLTRTSAQEPPGAALTSPEDEERLFGEAQPHPRSPVGPTPAMIAPIPRALLDATRDARNLPLPERMKALSEPLLGTPYLLDPLGEGAGADPDPLARYDAFDCVTFVEEVLALALAGDPVHAATVRLALRYGDRPPTYANRRHFMELQWIPGNVADGWIRDTTADYGVTTGFRREVATSLWASWSKRATFAHRDDELPLGTMRLDVLPLEQAIEAAHRIRPGTVLMVVRQDRPWVPLWITHFGLVVSGEQTTFRHATKASSGAKVRDQDLRRYLEHLRSYKSWPVAGVTLFEPVEQGPRLAALPREPAP